MNDWEIIEKELQQENLNYKILTADIADAEKNIAEKEHHLENMEFLLNQCQNVAGAIQTIAHHRIASIVTRCLNAIFDDPYEFEIIFERKRGKTEARPILKRNGSVIDDPVSASGGGVIDVASFALRLAAIVLSKPSKRKVLILDEPFKFVSKKYRGRIGQMLQEICEGYGVQTIMVTHIDELKTGNICNL